MAFVASKSVVISVACTQFVSRIVVQLKRIRQDLQKDGVWDRFLMELNGETVSKNVYEACPHGSIWNIIPEELKDAEELCITPRGDIISKESFLEIPY